MFHVFGVFNQTGNVSHITVLKSLFESVAFVHQVHLHSPIYHPVIKLFHVTAISTIPI